MYRIQFKLRLMQLLMRLRLKRTRLLHKHSLMRLLELIKVMTNPNRLKQLKLLRIPKRRMRSRSLVLNQRPRRQRLKQLNQMMKRVVELALISVKVLWCQSLHPLLLSL